MDKSYLKCFCLCFKCLEFFHKKKKYIYIYKTKTVLLTSILILLTNAVIIADKAHHLKICQFSVIFTRSTAGDIFILL